MSVLARLYNVSANRVSIFLDCFPFSLKCHFLTIFYQVIGIEPSESNILSGGKPGKTSNPSSHFLFEDNDLLNIFDILVICLLICLLLLKQVLTRFKGLELDLYRGIWTKMLLMKSYRFKTYFLIYVIILYFIISFWSFNCLFFLYHDLLRDRFIKLQVIGFFEFHFMRTFLIVSVIV